MTIRSAINRLTNHETLNFMLTNRIPRRTLTRFMGWFSKIEQPLVRDLSIATWRLFCDVDLSEARKTKFRSLRDCFVRRAQGRAHGRSIRTADVLVSPCDAIVGASGTVTDNVLLQVKGFPYTLDEFLCDPELAALYRNGRYITLRLTAGMYHRFHAPHDCRVEQVTHIAGDAWNVNPADPQARRQGLLQERARRAPARPRRRSHGHAGCRGGDPGRRYPAALRRHSRRTAGSRNWTHILRTPLSPRERRWVGSSTARPSLCWRRNG